MSGGSSQKSLRQALGAIKDTTTVSFAKVNSGYKEIDVAIVKATNHIEHLPAKEKYIRVIFSYVSSARPREDVAYCIHALAKRLSRTRNWVVALKTLVIIHRSLREVNPTFHEELINYVRSRNQILNMAHFKDDSSTTAWDYSAFVRTYALFLEEKSDCYRVLMYDIETDQHGTKDVNVVELLEQLPALQQLLFRVVCCQPAGATVGNAIIQSALSLVASETPKLQQAIQCGIANLVDKFFDMQRDDALKALEIYRRSCIQAERLLDFYEICKRCDIRHGGLYGVTEQPPSSFLQAMEEYLQEAPLATPTSKSKTVESKIPCSKEMHTLGSEYGSEDSQVLQLPPASPDPASPMAPKVEVALLEPPDLLELADPALDRSELDESNTLALAVTPAPDVQQSASLSDQTSAPTGWELSLVMDQSSNNTSTSASKLGGGLDKLTLDSLYDDAIRRSSQPVQSYNPWNPAMLHTIPSSAYPSATVVASPTAHMAPLANHQALTLQHQQIVLSQQQPSNPFGNPYASSVPPCGQNFPPSQVYDPYQSLI